MQSKAIEFNEIKSGGASKSNEPNGKSSNFDFASNDKVWSKVPRLENYWSICLQISIIIVSNECNCFTDSIDRNVEEKV